MYFFLQTGKRYRLSSFFIVIYGKFQLNDRTLSVLGSFTFTHDSWAKMVYFTCDLICYSVIICEIIIILFILSLSPNISSSVIKLPIMIITDYTIPDHTINDWSYYFLVLIPKVLLPKLTITIWSYPELYYNR